MLRIPKYKPDNSPVEATVSSAGPYSRRRREDVEGVVGEESSMEMGEETERRR